MFEHSVKVPRHYKVAANIFKKVSTEGGSVKTLLYDDKLRHFRTNVLYALITETIKHADDIDKIFENCSLVTNEPRLDLWLAKVLTAELLFGKKALPGKSKPEQTILSYKDQFEKYTADHQEDLKTEVVRRPRYVRINTNLLTTSDAIGAFQEEGYRFIRCTSGSYDDYLKQIQGLTEYDFTQDYHVKTVFVFSAGTKLHEHDLYLENKIILQDKATALAVHLLAPPPGSVVMDMCAAPGMKATQLAAYMRNEGKIYAVERNEKRYQTLCDFVAKTGSKCVQTIHKDALEIRRGDYDDVEYVLLDPSCSGSGMEFCVHNYIEEARLAKLTSLQEKFLKHAMNAFPNAKRIVYSTCSLFPEENERVITNVVKTSRVKWRVQDVKELLKGQWNNFGSGMYGSMGTRCLYARQESDYTSGFFLAVIDKDPKYFDKNNDAGNDKEDDEDKLQTNKSKSKSMEDVSEGGEEIVKPKRKKKKDRNPVVETNDIDPEVDSVVEEVPKKKKKRKRENKTDIDERCTRDSNEPNVDETEITLRVCEDTQVVSKKKRKNAIEEECNETVEVEGRKNKKKRKKQNDEAGLEVNNQDLDDAGGRNKKKRKKQKLDKDISKESED
ncbi:nop2/Sun-like domain containing protein 5 [Choristoneura fumiferana]|uniref:nop2/Sun-like domain containing protein 5 n=1 Tax=Choristoneura fumiferana TaxID=7141 RepID=UPI003D15CAFA